MVTRRPAFPAPPPVKPIAKRLEEVRKRAGIPSLRGFWTRLKEEWAEEDQISYEAIRAYHYDRDPPIGYLVRVSEAFGVSLSWLATGREEGGERHLPFRFQEVDDDIESEDLFDMVKRLDLFRELPPAGRDVLLTFLYDVRFRYPEIEDAELEKILNRLFSTEPLLGSYGEQMALILSQAQVAYLLWFGSWEGGPGSETEDEPTREED